MWSPDPEWEGQRSFVLAGGSTASGQIHLIPKDERVIVVNSAWESFPEADILFFHDCKWWEQYKNEIRARFKGRVVTTSRELRGVSGLLNLRRLQPPEVKRSRGVVTMARTSTAGALHLASNLGSTVGILLGADGQLAEDGTRHHHGVAYPWKFRPLSFDRHIKELTLMAPYYRQIGFRVINVSPRTRLEMFERMSLEEALRTTG